MLRLINTIREFIRKCHSLSKETALLCFVVVALAIVVLHAVMAGLAAAVRRKCASQGSQRIKFRESADYSRFATAILDKNTLIVLSANRYFAQRCGRTAAELIEKRFASPSARATLAPRCVPASSAALTNMRDGAIHNVPSCWECSRCISEI